MCSWRARVATTVLEGDHYPRLLAFQGLISLLSYSELRLRLQFIPWFHFPWLPHLSTFRVWRWEAPVPGFLLGKQELAASIKSILRKIASFLDTLTPFPEKSRQATAVDRKSRYCLDADLLDCPICSEPLSVPVFQCENGHRACASCCTKFAHRRCPSCTQPTGRIRCLAVEKLIESLQVSCQHAVHGCEEMLPFGERSVREEHETETCEYKPLTCPHPRCSHVSRRLELPAHLRTAHEVESVQASLPGGYLSFVMALETSLVVGKVGVDRILLVHRDSHEIGDDLFCSTLSGASQVYKLEVTPKDTTAIYSLQTSAPSVHKLVDRSRHLHDCLHIPAIANRVRQLDVKLSVVSGSKFMTGMCRRKLVEADGCAVQ